MHLRASEDEGQGQPPLPLASAALRTGLEGGGGPSMAATLALGGAPGRQEEAYSVPADLPDREEQQVQDQMSFTSCKVLC